VVSSAPPACRFFAERRCQKGASCPFAHVEKHVAFLNLSAELDKVQPGGDTRLPCKFFAESRCTRLSCPYAHVLPALSSSSTGQIPCRFFAVGRCNRGSACKYLHDPAVGTSIPIQVPLIEAPSKEHMCVFVGGACVDGEFCPKLSKSERIGHLERSDSLELVAFGEPDELTVATDDPYMPVESADSEISKVSEEQRVAIEDALRKFGPAREAIDREIEQVCSAKQTAIATEDYDVAHAAEQREKESSVRLDELSKSGSSNAGDAGNVAVEQELREVESALREMQAQKLAAAEAWDFSTADAAMQREKELMERLEALRKRRGPGCGKERQRIEAELAIVRAQKLAAAEAENFDAADIARQREMAR